MELPPNAPRRKSDLYLYQTSEITATLRRIESTVEAKATKSQTPNVKHHYESTGNLVAVANFQPFWSIFSHFEAFLAVLDKSLFNRTKKIFGPGRAF